MPIFFTAIGDECKLGVWEITESQSDLEKELVYRSSAKHPERRNQQLAARKMLHALEPAFPFQDVIVSETGKPIVADGSIEFSLSHCKGYAAAIIGTSHPVGIDIEWVSNRASRIASRFLCQQEMNLINGLGHGQSEALITMLWSVKETIYKWWGRKGVDFARNILVMNSDWQSSVQFSCSLNGEVHQGTVQIKRFGNLWLTYI
jgi:phosphopantetheine--protein transferase-like protein